MLPVASINSEPPASGDSSAVLVRYRNNTAYATPGCMGPFRQYNPACAILECRSVRTGYGASPIFLEDIAGAEEGGGLLAEVEGSRGTRPGAPYNFH